MIIKLITKHEERLEINLGRKHNGLLIIKTFNEIDKKQFAFSVRTDFLLSAKLGIWSC